MGRGDERPGGARMYRVACNGIYVGFIRLALRVGRDMPLYAAVSVAVTSVQRGDGVGATAVSSFMGIFGVVSTLQLGFFSR